MPLEVDMKLYIGIFLGVFFLYLLYKAIQHKNLKSRLGARLLKLPAGTKNAEFPMYVVVSLLCVGGAIWYPFRYSEFTYEGYIFAALMGLFGANALFPIIMASTEKGLYAQGTMAMAGIAEYGKFASYRIIKRKHGQMQVVLASRSKFFGKSFGFITAEKDKKQVEKILKKNGIEKK